MDIQTLKSLIDLFAQAPLQELDVSDGACALRITRAPRHATAQDSACPSPPAQPPSAENVDTPQGPVPAGTPVLPPATAHTLCAPLYGTLHLAPSPDAPPFVAVGDNLSIGQQIGLIEAMKVFTPVKATCAGKLETILAEDGQEVEAEQPLMRLS